jgi:CRP-like cAMP-binding protein
VITVSSVSSSIDTRELDSDTCLRRPSRVPRGENRIHRSRLRGRSRRVPHKRLAAGEFLQRGGEVTRHAAFVAKGCLRNYVIDPKGREHIIQFAPETWWLADAPSLTNRTPSQYFIDAIEDSELLLIDGRRTRSS